MLNKKILYSM